jgi:uncharacterized protein YjgD (DUF1641 family)
MKILYVEDELEKNIPKIIRMFRKYLGTKICKKLQQLEEDEFGATANDILKIFEKSSIVKLENSFPKALDWVLNHYNEFEFYIIDRNLSNIMYELEDLKKIDPKFNENFYDKFFEREGDYFLELLISKNFDVKNKFFFLTANSSDRLRNEDEIQNHIDFDRFQDHNFIDKSNMEELRQLVRQIEDSKLLNLMKENERYLQILRKIDENLKNTFVELLKKKDDTNREQITQNMSNIRLVFINIITMFALSHNLPDTYYSFNKKNEKQINMSGFIKWVKDYNYKKFSCSSIISNFLYSIKEVSSDYGAHMEYGIQRVEYKPTTDTVNSLIYALKDIITWYDELSIK